MAPASQTAMEEPLNPLPGALRMFMARPRRGSRCAPDPAPRVLGLSLCGALFLGACGADKAPLDPLLSDDRIAPLLAPCARAGPFTADTSHMLPLLVAKLESGQRDVLHRAKEELAELDEVAIPALGALLDRHLTEAYMAGLNQNILEVAVMMEGDAGRPLFVKALDHPQEILRTTAVRGLARHGRPADFDLLLPWIDLAPHLESFADTAAVLAALDLVISTDTSVPHLAGALGCPTWLLLHHTADWRWQEQRPDSPWYPTMRIFRQPAAGDWPALTAELDSALAALPKVASPRQMR